MKCSISNIANVISESIPNPAESGFDIFVGLEHYDSGEVKVTRYGSTQNLVTAVKVFRKGDILLARRNVYLKRAGLVDFDGVTSGDSIVLRVKDDLSSLSLQSEDIRMYLPFVLNTEEFWNYAEKYSDGTMSKRLSPKTLLQYEFDIPDDVTEKNRLLWQAYKTKESYKAMILATDEMVKSQFIELVQRCNPEKKTLESICTRGPQNGFYRKGAEIDGTIPIVKMSQLFGFESMSDVSHFDLVSMTEDEIRRFSLTENDLLFGRRSLVPEGAGKCRRAGKIDKTVVFESSILRVSIDPAICYPRFIQAWTESPEGEQSISELRAGTSVVGITGSGLSKVMIPVPTKSVQDVFIGVAEQADKSKFELKQAIERIDKVMRALMQ